MKYYKKIALVVCAAMMGTMLGGCGGGAKKEESTTEVRIATMTTGFTVALHYAQNNGIYEELGLKTTEMFFENGPSINEAIASGDVDVAGIGQMPSITGALRNNSKVVAWMEDDESSVQGYARNDSDIVAAGKGNIDDYPDIWGTPETWKGKEILVAKGTSSHFALLATLSAMGLTEDDVVIVNMEGASGAAAFASGTGDIFFGFDPQWAEMYSNSDEYTQISSISATNKNLMSVLVASNDFVENHPDELVKIIQGLLKAEQIVGADQDNYDAEMYTWQSTFGSSSETLAAYSAQIKPLRSIEEQLSLFEETNGSTPMMDAMCEIADFMISNNLIEAADKDKLIESNPVRGEFLKEAAANLK